MRSTHTRAAVLAHARGPVSVESLHFGEPAAGEVLLRMEACGICHSDLFVAGLEKLPLAPLTLGHEGIGRVEAVGPGVDNWATGDRAGITFLGVTCGTCEWCAAGRERFCPKQTNFGYTLQGALGDYALAPASALVRVPDDSRRRRCRTALLRRLDRLRSASRGGPRARPIGGPLRLRRPRPPGAADRPPPGIAHRRVRSLRGKAGPRPRRRSGHRRRRATWMPRLSSRPRPPPFRKPSARCAATAR